MSLRKTEMLHPQAKGLDALSGAEVLHRLLAGQVAAVTAVEGALGPIESAAQLFAETVLAGGKVYYAAAGSSGLMGLADALELPGTFGLSADTCVVLMAGGVQNLTKMPGDVEDDRTSALADAEPIGSGDCVICISASGSTPYPMEIKRVAMQSGARVISIANTCDSPLLADVDVAVFLNTPPELIAGSTRLGAGSAQKVALNMISTLAGVMLGHVHDGFMVNLYADNTKLIQRAARIVAAIAECDGTAARGYLEQAKGAVKPAVLLAKGAENLLAAQDLLDNATQNLRVALDHLEAGSAPSKPSDQSRITGRL